MRKLFFTLFLSILTSVVFAGTSSSVEPSDYDKPIIVSAKEPQVKLTLPANMTTGFSWFVESYDPNLVQPITTQYTASQNNKMTGAPGTSVWTFRILQTAFLVPHVIQIKMIYARPWDLRNANEKIVTIITQ